MTTDTPEMTVTSAETTNLCSDCLAYYTAPRPYQVIRGQEGPVDDSALLFALDEFHGEESDECVYLVTVKNDRELKDGDVVLGRFDETFDLYETSPFEVIGIISRGGEFFVNTARMGEYPVYSDPDYPKGLFMHEDDFDYHPHDQHCECDQCIEAFYGEFPEAFEELEDIGAAA